ncbi:MAG: 4Fe-4S binding protein [Firmicutes bacterium]|nr:4Fe-4S binding protein [Bacillota bacterium]
MAHANAAVQQGTGHPWRRRRLVIDLDRCWGCHACEVACKREHGLPPGAAAIRVERIGPRRIGGRLRTAYVPCLCQHCEDPVCSAACPFEAFEKGPHGEVRIVRDRCTCCGQCAEACPYGAIELGGGDRVSDGVAGAPARTPATAPGTTPHAALYGPPVKCDLCTDRLSTGLPPSCLQHCEGRAIALLDDESFEQVRLGRYAWSTGAVVYISTEWPALGRALR